MTDKHPPLTMSMFGSMAALRAEQLYQALERILPLAQDSIDNSYINGYESVARDEKDIEYVKQVMKDYKENK